MRWLVGGLALVAMGVPAVAGADIFLYRDRFGTLHLTNAPAKATADGPARLLVKERPLPPGPKILVVGRGGGGFAAWPPRGRRSPTAYDDLIREIAARHDVEYATVKAVIHTESAFNSSAVSPKGAQGLMQLMPATAQQHRVQDAFVPRQNIEGGVRHLRMLLDRYDGNLPFALAAYNAGTVRVDNAGGIPSITETQNYVARVLRYRLDYMREGSGVLTVRR
jgi:soluble lytic murein transglycosylase-like protein